MIFCGYGHLILIHSIRLGALGGNHMSIASGVPIYVMIDIRVWVVRYRLLWWINWLRCPAERIFASDFIV